MGNNTRKEVLSVLDEQTRQGIIVLDSSKRKQRQVGLKEAESNYEVIRKQLLLEEYPRFYRLGIFGSARLPDNCDEFRFVSDLARRLVREREMDIVTGGGPGIMEAAHRGTQRAIDEVLETGRQIRARNYGVTISSLPWQVNNGYLHYESQHKEFPARLQTFEDLIHSAYFALGGIGTLLELSYLVQEHQVRHLEDSFKLIAHPMFQKIIASCEEVMYGQRVENGQIPLISENNFKVVIFSNDIDEIASHICRSYDLWYEKYRSHVRIISDD